MTRFHYSSRVYLWLWLFAIVCWAIVVLLSKNDVTGFSFVDIFFVFFGVVAFVCVLLALMLDLIEWRRPPR